MSTLGNIIKSVKYVQPRMTIFGVYYLCKMGLYETVTIIIPEFNQYEN